MEIRELEEKYKKRIRIARSTDVSHEMRDILGWEKEAFVVFSLDPGNRVISRDIVAVGILDSVIIHPREVFRTAVSRNAKSIIVSHNHPSGRSNPSDEDRRITERLYRAGEILGITVLDHVVVAQGEHYSFAENGEMEG